MEIPTTSKEREMYEEKILKDHSGNGTIYTGNYYTLNYQPSRESSYSLKCDGVELVTRRIGDKYAHDFPIRTVLLKTYKFGVIWKLLFPDYCKSTELPFKDRLKLQIDNCIQEIKEKEKHLEEVTKTAESITRCQRKIDKTMSEFKVEE